MGISNGESYQRIFKGNVTKIVPKRKGGLPTAYIVETDEIVTVADRYSPPPQYSGQIHVFEESMSEYLDWKYNSARACMLVMQQWVNIVRHDWNQKNKDFFWKLYDLAVANLGLGEVNLLEFASDRLPRPDP